MEHQIFISYSSKHNKVAFEVCRFLEQNNYKCWIAPRDIPAGSDYGDQIEEAIITAKVVILIFNQDAMNSKWVKGEINTAFNENKTILTFKTEDKELHGALRVMLNQFHTIDAVGNTNKGLNDLLSEIKNICVPEIDPPTTPKPKTDLVKLPYFKRDVTIGIIIQTLAFGFFAFICIWLLYTKATRNSATVTTCDLLLLAILGCIIFCTLKIKKNKYYLPTFAILDIPAVILLLTISKEIYSIAITHGYKYISYPYQLLTDLGQEFHSHSVRTCLYFLILYVFHLAAIYLFMNSRNLWYKIPAKSREMIYKK